jgi:hypothetical protein
MEIPALSGIDVSEDEYRETLAHAKRFEFTNGVVTAKRGPYMTQKSHVAIAEEVSAGVELADEVEEAGGGSAEVRRQLGDLITQAIQFGDIIGRSSAFSGKLSPPWRPPP